MTKPKSPGPEALYLGRQNNTPRSASTCSPGWKAGSRRLQRAQRGGYRERLLPFMTWCEERGLLYAPQISTAVLEAYQRHLRSYRKADGNTLAVGGQQPLKRSEELLPLAAEAASSSTVRQKCDAAEGGETASGAGVQRAGNAAGVTESGHGEAAGAA